MIRSLVVAFYSLGLGFRFWRTLAIRPRETAHYVNKLFSLGLLYAAFVKPTTARGCAAAGRAAFLSCAYDVATDWRLFSPEFRRAFEKQLHCLVPEWAVRLTMKLYRAELSNTLGDDGLERGVIAVDFITGVVGSRPFFSQFGLRRLGRFLQILDDILDFEDDVNNDELNCLKTARAAQHIEFFEENRRESLELFRPDPIMRLAIARASLKAEVLRDSLK